MKSSQYHLHKTKHKEPNMNQTFKQFKDAQAKIVYDRYIEKLNKRTQKMAWDSSAQKLEKSLKKHGIILSQRLYYEYKFPNNLKNFEFYNISFAVCRFAAFYDNYLERLSGPQPKKKLFFDAPSDMSVFFGFCISLALSDIADINKRFAQKYDTCIKEIKKATESIRALNPELQHIKNYKNIDFLCGAIFGFAPQEIEFFINLQERRKKRSWEFEASGGDEEVNKSMENAKTIAAFIKHDVTYFLAPETGNKIIKSIEQHQMTLQQINTKEL